MSGEGEGDLERRLDALKAGARRETEIEAELEETARLLDGIEGPRSRLDDVRVASPCGESWDGMVGDDRRRFCMRCEKHVYDLSAMNRIEAEAFLAAQGETACVRFFRRDDGTVMTADCPVGARKKRVRLALLSAGAGVLATAAAASLGVTQGKPACRARPPAGTVHAPLPPAAFPPVPIDTAERAPQPEGRWMMGAPPARPAGEVRPDRHIRR
jgi:hypothetical protein